MNSVVLIHDAMHIEILLFIPTWSIRIFLDAKSTSENVIIINLFK